MPKPRWCFRGVFCLHHQGLTNVSKILTASINRASCQSLADVSEVFSASTIRASLMFQRNLLPPLSAPHAKASLMFQRCFCLHHQGVINASGVFTAFIIGALCQDLTVLIMGLISTRVTPIIFYQTEQCSFLEASHLHTRDRQNLKSHLCVSLLNFSYASIWEIVVGMTQFVRAWLVINLTSKTMRCF
jgi:hypothetical protein